MHCKKISKNWKLNNEYLNLMSKIQSNKEL